MNGRFRLRTAPGRAVPWAAAAASGVLTACAFPPLGWAPAAWVALAPLAWGVWGRRPAEALRLGLVAGLARWVPSLYWLHRVTVAGWLLLALYCALYTVPFALWVAGSTRRRSGPGPAGGLVLMASGAAVWAGSEYLRATLFTGFPWNALGVSQYRNTALVQSAEWGGVFAVSALVVFVNLALAVAARGRAARGGRRRLPHAATAAGLLAVLLAVSWGAQRVRSLPAASEVMRLALVQPAVAQDVKWTEAFVDASYARLDALSRAALRAGAADLVVWPETALPEAFRESEPAGRLVHGLAGEGTPLLFGSLDTGRGEDGVLRYFNSAFLVDAGGALRTVYDKQHLVVLGEYVPFARYLPFLRSLTPVGYDITPGGEPVLFRLAGEGPPFAVLICFEDTVAGVTRTFARRGARLFVTLTNDAWFDPTSGSLQHMAQSVFRAVETRTPMARCANSGVTCWIDAAGRVRAVQPYRGSDGAPLAGFLRAAVPLRPAGAAPTFHTRHGDLFGAACAAAALLALAREAPAWRRRKAGGSGPRAPA